MEHALVQGSLLPGALIPGCAVIAAQSLSCVQLFAIPWSAACQVSLSFTISWSMLKFMSIESVMPSNHLVLCHPLLLLPSIFPSIRVFSNESALGIRWPKYWSFSFCINPSNEYLVLISFRIDWFDLLAVQGTLKTLLQHHSSKASILWPLAFLMVQLSHPYMTTALDKSLCLSVSPFPHQLYRVIAEGSSKAPMNFWLCWLGGGLVLRPALLLGVMCTDGPDAPFSRDG